MQCTVVPQTTIWSSAEQISAHHYLCTVQSQWTTLASIQCKSGVLIWAKYSQECICHGALQCGIAMEFVQLSTIQKSFNFAICRWRCWAKTWVTSPVEEERMVSRSLTKIFAHVLTIFGKQFFSLKYLCMQYLNQNNTWKTASLKIFPDSLLYYTIWTKTILYDFKCNIFAGEDLYVFGSIVRKLRVEEEGRVVRTSPRPCAAPNIAPLPQRCPHS